MLEALYALTIATIGYTFGYFMRDIRDLALKAYTSARERIQPEEPQPEFQSMTVEPLTPEQQAHKDFQDRVKKLNGQV